MQEIKITKEQLKNFGSCSLLGVIGNTKFDLSKPIKLLFEQTSINWRKSNNGVANIVIPEFTIGCLLEDVVNLMKNGVQIQIDEWDNDPPPPAPEKSVKELTKIAKEIDHKKIGGSTAIGYSTSIGHFIGFSIEDVPKDEIEKSLAFVKPHCQLAMEEMLSGAYKVTVW